MPNRKGGKWPWDFNAWENAFCEFLNRPKPLMRPEDLRAFRRMLMYRSNRSFTMPPPPGGIPRAFDTFAVPGRREFDYQNLLGGGEFELHHVKSLAWRPIMGDAVLEDFRGKDCAFVANWLRGKG